MSTDTPTIAIGDDTYPIPPLTTDKGLRLLAIVSEAGEELQVILDRAMEWRAENAERNAVTITAAAFDDDDAAARLAGMGITREMVEAQGQVTIPLPPDDNEVILHALPAAFRALPDLVLQACAIVIAPGDELLDADDAGELDDYISGWVRRIRRETTPDQFADLLAAVVISARAELFDNGGAVGKVMSVVGTLMGGEKSPAPKKTGAPRSKPKPKSSTRSRPPTGGAGASAS